MLSLRSLWIYVLLACSFGSVQACGSMYKPQSQASRPFASEELDHAYAFTPADFGIPNQDGQFSRVQSLGVVAGYAAEAGLSFRTNAGKSTYRLLLSTHESPTSHDGQFEVTATAACEGASSPEVTMIHPIATDQTDIIAQCSGVPKAFSIQSIRFIPDRP